MSDSKGTRQMLGPGLAVMLQQVLMGLWIIRSGFVGLSSSAGASPLAAKGCRLVVMLLPAGALLNAAVGISCC
ncbi:MULTISPECIES: hypothetical protein [Paenibacillus]|uniref:hypothetical protein n=1 Tax=Paenibacillus TaxID=44249 RepID=UPI000D714A83|nr:MULTISPECIES: hypothetical protein [Paenibacillus]